MRVDLHTHFLPLEYWRMLAEAGEGYEVVKDGFDRTIMKKDGARVLTQTPPMFDPEARIGEMDAAGIDVQVLSTPNVPLSTAEKNLEQARVCNNILAQVRDRYPNRFMCLASVPLQNVDMAVDELDRAINRMGMNGVIVPSNVNGRPLASPELEPFWSAVNRQKLAVLMHPAIPIGIEAMRDYGLAPLVGFMFDCNLAVARMIFDGLFERYPDISFVMPHMGASVTVLMERWDYGFREMPDCRLRISRPPSEYVKKLYFDTVIFHKPALMCCFGSVGAGQMVLGSDYPHITGDIYRSVSTIKSMDIEDEEKEVIFGGNALRILRAH